MLYTVDEKLLANLNFENTETSCFEQHKNSGSLLALAHLGNRRTEFLETFTLQYFWIVMNPTSSLRLLFGLFMELYIPNTAEPAKGRVSIFA